MARHPWVAAADNGKPRWGVQLIAPNERGALPALMETAKLAESLGFDAAFVFDHPALHADPWVALSGMATITNRIRLGSAVNCNGYRHPGMLARLGADLDNLSQGRLLFGIGSGWLDWEFAAFDLEFRSVPKRQAALDEALQIIQGVWGDRPFTFNGDYHRVKNLQIQPPPPQTPRPPIIIGGSGERVTLRQVAQYADACNISENWRRMTRPSPTPTAPPPWSASSMRCASIAAISAGRKTRCCGPISPPTSSLARLNLPPTPRPTRPTRASRPRPGAVAAGATASWSPRRNGRSRITGCCAPPAPSTSWSSSTPPTTKRSRCSRSRSSRKSHSSFAQ